MKIEINTNQGAIDLDTDDLPGELKDLYSFLEEKSVTLSSYLILARTYRSKAEITISASLLNKGAELVLTQYQAFPKEELETSIQDLISFCFFLLNLCSDSELLDKHFTSIQDSLSHLVDTIKQLSPQNVDLPVIKGFWQFYNHDHNRAALYFTKALTRDANKTAASIGLGLSSYYLGKYELALSKFLRVAFLSTGSCFNGGLQDVIDFRICIALCQIGLGRSEAAIKSLRGIIQQTPAKVDAYALLAFIRLSQFKGTEVPEQQEEAFRESFQVCTQALQAHPGHPALSLVLSELYFCARRYEEAFELSRTTYNNANLAAKKLRCEACYLGAKSKYILGEDIEANALLNQALLYIPGHEPSVVLQALLIFKEGDIEKALKRLEAVVAQGQFKAGPQLFSNDVQLNLLYIILYARLNKISNSKDYILSDPEFARHLNFVKSQLGPTTTLTPAHRYNIFAALAEVANAYERREGWLGAEASFKDTLTVYAHSVRTEQDNVNLAKCANNAGAARLMHDASFVTCQEYFDFALRQSALTSPNDGGMLALTISYNIALNLEKTGRVADAISKLEELRARQPSYFNGDLVQKGGDATRAARLYKEVIDSAGDSNIPHVRQCAANAYILLGTLQQSLREYKAARTSFKMVLSKYDENDFYSLCAVGHNYFLVARQEEDPRLRAKCYQDSALYFRKALKLEPENPFPVAGVGCLLAAQNQFKTARKVFKEIGSSVEATTFGTNYAHCCFRLELFQEAANSYAHVLENCPDKIRFALLQCHARALYALGIKTANLKHIEHSILQLKQAKDLNPSEMTLVFDEGLVLQKYCQLVCERNPSEVGTYRIERSLSFLEEAKRNFEQLTLLRPESMCGFNPQLLQSRIGFCKTIHSNLLQRLEAAQAAEIATPRKSIQTYGLDMRKSFELFHLTDSLPAVVEPEVPALEASPLQLKSPVYESGEPLSQDSPDPKPTSEDGDEYDPSEVVADSNKI